MRCTHRPLAVAFSLFALSGCVNELNPHVREEHAEHDVAFVAQDDALAASLTEEGDYLVGPIVDRTDAPFTRIAIRFDSQGDVIAEARPRAADGAWGEWAAFSESFVEEGAHNAVLDVEAGAVAFQVRFLTATTITFFAAEAFEYEPSPADADLVVDTEESMSDELQALAADGIVVTRGQWGARSRSCGPRHSPSRLTIHHTVTPNNDSMSMPARMRQIQNFHINGNGWCDIGYHFLIGQDGRVYQGRMENIVGAHAASANTNNVGISFIGTFTDRAPSTAMMDAAARIMKAMSRTYGISLNRDKVKGHRQVGTTATSCPGNALYNQLSSLINRAQGSGGGGGGGGGSSTNSCPRVRVDADALNVRPQPNTSRAAVGSLSRGERVTRLSTATGQSVSGNNRWYRIEQGSMRGYVSAAYASCVQ